MSQFDFFHKILDRLSADIPDNYICVDLETTGFVFDYKFCTDRENYSGDLIVEVGTCDVTNHNASHYDTEVLDWHSANIGITEEWLRGKFSKCSAALAAKDRVYSMSFERMVGEGRNPVTVLEDTVELLRSSMRDGRKIVGFNAFVFDRKVLTDAASEWLDDEFYIPDELIFDVGLLEKAAQLDMLPIGDESCASFFTRVRDKFARGVYWNLDSCVKKYGLSDLYGIAEKDTHNAGVDAMVTHLIFREMLGV